jgi:hypothetical protein
MCASREGTEPAAVELDTGHLAVAAHSAWRLEDDVIRKHFGKPVEVVGVEGVRPLLERLARGHRHMNLLRSVTRSHLRTLDC